MSIEEILKRLFGRIAPVGETNEDNRRYENIENYYEALNFIIKELKYVSKYKDRNEYSMQKIGKECLNILQQLKIDIDE